MQLPPAGAIAALALPLLLVAAATGLAFAPQTDEIKFHWDVARQFGDALPAVPWQDYHAATTPLPYVVWGAWGRLFGYSLPALRALTLLVSLAGVAAFYDLAHRRGHRWPAMEAALLLFSPYVFLNSFTVYTVNMGLPFAVLALRGYLDADGSRLRPLLWGSAAATAAVLCRQHYLFLPAGMAIWWLLRLIWARRWPAAGDLSVAAVLALPALALAPICLTWGGLTPPALQSLHALRPQPQHLNFLLVFIGLYAAPVGLAAWPALLGTGRRALLLLPALPLYAAFRPYYGAGDLEASEQGIVLRGLEAAGGAMGPALPAIGELALWANGLAIVAGALARPAAPRDEATKLWGCVGAFAVILLVSGYVGERFYALIVPVLLLLLYPHVAGRRAATLVWVAGSALVSAVYAATKMAGG